MTSGKPVVGHIIFDGLEISLDLAHSVMDVQSPSLSLLSCFNRQSGARSLVTVYRFLMKSYGSLASAQFSISILMPSEAQVPSCSPA